MAFRTDLAIENKEMYDESRGNQGEIPGVEVKVRQETKKIKVTRIAVKDETGSRIMGKPCGNISLSRRRTSWERRKRRRKRRHVWWLGN